jgi:hypothetical protein
MRTRIITGPKFTNNCLTNFVNICCIEFYQNAYKNVENMDENQFKLLSKDMNLTVLICQEIPFAVQHYTESAYAKFHPNTFF